MSRPCALAERMISCGQVPRLARYRIKLPVVTRQRVVKISPVPPAHCRGWIFFVLSENIGFMRRPNHQGVRTRLGNGNTMPDISEPGRYLSGPESNLHLVIARHLICPLIYRPNAVSPAVTS